MQSLLPGFEPEEYLPDVVPPQSERQILQAVKNGSVLVANYGGGVNSTAMVLEMLTQGLRPAYILFADTQNEHQYTLDYVALFNDWLKRNHGLTVSRCDNVGQHASLEAECLTNHCLVSLAYGFRGCSVKWKRQPMDRWLKAREDCRQNWVDGRQVIRCIGIHAGESHRGNIPDTKGFAFWRPLVDWNINQEACEETILSHGLPLPRKSSCWFCPAKTKREILQFASETPDLFARAVAMEHNARDSGTLKTTVGLGRHWTWEGLVAASEAQRKLFPDTESMPCIWCDDGGCPTAP